MATPMRTSFATLSLSLGLLTLVACGGDGPPTGTTDGGSGPVADCSGANPSPLGAEAGTAPLSVQGSAPVTTEYTGEVWTQGGFAYTTTWGRRGAANIGNKVRVWDVRGATPVLTACLTVPNATTTGDVQVSDDGTLLMVATESGPGSIALYSIATPGKPTLIVQYTSPTTEQGVHTAELARVNGTLYGFLSIDPGASVPAKLVVVDLTDPGNPREVFVRPMGNPYVHDVFVRDGVLFTALWNDGVGIWDIGGLGKGGTVAAPVRVGTAATVGGQVHNVWWYRDGQSGARKYLFVGQEGPGAFGSASRGDVHVVDVSDLTAPREVAFFNVPGAGTHNFSVDEANGVLYAAYYNGGVRAIDVRGDLGGCTAAQKSSDGRCDLTAMGRALATGLTDRTSYVWGVKLDGGYLYASDMLDGLWKLKALPAR
jgi:hypothetical protein